MKNVLIILESMILGGVESTVLKMIKELHKSGKIHVDIFYANNAFSIEKEFVDAGCKIYHSDYWREDIKNHQDSLLEVLRDTNNPVYDVIHAMSIRQGLFIKHIVKAAKNGKLDKNRLPKMRVLQSHMFCPLTTMTLKYFRNSLAAKIIFQPFGARWITDKIGVSKKAADFMFWKYERKTVMPNFVDFDEFISARNLRKEIESDTFSIGSCGRLTTQKNPLFLVEVTKELAKRHPEINWQFHWFGEGDLRIRAIELILNDDSKAFDPSQHPEIGKLGFGWSHEVKAGNLKAVFYGHIMRDQVAKEIASKLDIFGFPSLFEGFGISLLEADAAAIPCIASSVVPIETNVSGKIIRLKARWSRFFGVNKNDVKKWANAIEKIRLDIINNVFENSVSNSFSESIYSVKNAAKIWEEFYFKNSN